MGLYKKSNKYLTKKRRLKKNINPTKQIKNNLFNKKHFNKNSSISKRKKHFTKKHNKFKTKKKFVNPLLKGGFVVSGPLLLMGAVKAVKAVRAAKKVKNKINKLRKGSNKFKNIADKASDSMEKAEAINETVQDATGQSQDIPTKTTMDDVKNQLKDGYNQIEKENEQEIIRQNAEFAKRDEKQITLDDIAEIFENPQLLRELEIADTSPIYNNKPIYSSAPGFEQIKDNVKIWQKRYRQWYKDSLIKQPSAIAELFKSAYNILKTMVTTLYKGMVQIKDYAATGMETGLKFAGPIVSVAKEAMV